MKRGLTLLAAVMAFTCLFFTGTASGDSPAYAKDYTVVTEDGQYILVMLSSNAKGDYDQRGNPKPDLDIRAKYSQAGLYRNDCSTTPLWTIDWYSFGVELSSDGQHLVQYGPWAREGNYQELALAFHENGKLLARYAVTDLVANPSSLPHSTSHYMWLKDASFDDARAELAIETHHGEKYVFDVRTGKAISGTLPTAEQGSPVLGLTLAFSGLVVLVAVLVVLRARRNSNKTVVESAY